MEKKKIVITGAGGYIGRHVVDSLLARDNIHVIAVDTSEKGINSQAEFVSLDIFSSNDLYQELGSPDACLHLAWRDGFNHNSPYHLEAFSDHFSFLKQLVDGGIKQIAVMGTMHEVGYYEGAVNENTLCNPTSFYGISKNALRQAMQLYTKDKKIIFQWLRAFYIYGDDLKNNSVFTKLIQAEKEGKEVFPFTTGSNKYDFISVQELAEQLGACVAQDQVAGIINCCSGEGVSLKDKVEAFIQEQQLKIKLKYGAFPDRPYDSPGIWGDSSKIQQVMLHTRNNIGEGIPNGSIK
ncbi:NAD(P)-dependent oxidoreductase [Gorillibacterium sp. CAU 1737]|uniref:NAD-dependent epimerase/dehydratase family protein n=1 Tax=Gorillibacterium sp. CAU 1737 TaxID=3140362 RepID=UPI0032617776